MARVETPDALRKLVGSTSEMVPHKIHRESIREFDQAVVGRYKTDL